MDNTNIALLASYWTISAAYPHTDREYSPFQFQDRVESAARAGFRGFGLWHADLEHVLEKTTLREMKRIFEDNGIEYVELEFLTDWFMGGEKRKKSDDVRRLLLQAAEAFGAHHIKVGDFHHTQAEMPRVIEEFRQLCVDGANYGTKIGFELMPFAMIDSLEGALRLVEGAGQGNGGLTLDLWHVVKLGIPYEEIARIPQRYLTSVELNDGTFSAPWSLHEQTINHRRLCGEGEFDVVGFIQAVQQTRYQGPWGIEVLCEELRRLPLDELTTRSFATTAAQFRAPVLSNRCGAKRT
ncbi:MAG: sugar phosphate isomerase/epimerase [Acidobacteria bacterium]|nr:sugar phosphate isomerase/epimerase [Acidobacteriota bacterium]